MTYLFIWICSFIFQSLISTTLFKSFMYNFFLRKIDNNLYEIEFLLTYFDIKWILLKIKTPQKIIYFAVSKYVELGT